MEIWMADFNFGYKSVINGKHPCVILSTWKTCIKKGGSINVVPLTSNLIKYVSTQVDLKGFNLKEESKALINQILTVDKSCLLFKIGMVNDISTQLEIEKSIEAQLELSNKFVSTENAEQLEDFFLGNTKVLNNKAIYGKLKNEIGLFAKTNRIEECAVACTKLIELVLASTIENKAEFLWFGYYHRAWTFIKLKHYDMAITDARQSLKFTGNLKEGLNNRYSYSMWVLSNAYENVDVDKSVELYTSLVRYYKSMGRTNLQIDILFNIAKCKKNVNRMITLIKIMEKFNFVENETNKTKEIILEQMNNDLNLMTQ